MGTSSLCCARLRQPHSASRLASTACRGFGSIDAGVAPFAEPSGLRLRTNGAGLLPPSPTRTAYAQAVAGALATVRSGGEVQGWALADKATVETWWTIACAKPDASYATLPETLAGRLRLRPANCCGACGRSPDGQRTATSTGNATATLHALAASSATMATRQRLGSRRTDDRLGRHRGDRCARRLATVSGRSASDATACPPCAMLGVSRKHPSQAG